MPFLISFCVSVALIHFMCVPVCVRTELYTDKEIVTGKINQLISYG